MSCVSSCLFTFDFEWSHKETHVSTCHCVTVTWQLRHIGKSGVTWRVCIFWNVSFFYDAICTTTHKKNLFVLLTNRQSHSTTVHTRDTVPHTELITCHHICVKGNIFAAQILAFWGQKFVMPGANHWNVHRISTSTPSMYIIINIGSIFYSRLSCYWFPVHIFS